MIRESWDEQRLVIYTFSIWFRGGARLVIRPADAANPTNLYPQQEDGLPEGQGGRYLSNSM